MTDLDKYFSYIKILEKTNKKLNLDDIDVLLLNAVAQALDAGRTLSVKDILLMKDIASQATIHGRLKHLVNIRLITLQSNKDDGRIKNVLLTALAHKRHQILCDAMRG